MKKCCGLVARVWLMPLMVITPSLVAAGCSGGITQVACNTYQEIKQVNSKVDTILSCSSSILGGDVTGSLCNNVVRFVGGQSAVDVAAATLAVQAATPFDAPGTLVLRDILGNFSANMITLDGLVMNPTDAATKAYVDSVASAGLVVKDPALVVSLTNVSLSGTPTIDGVVLMPDDRVLLIGQVNPIENGLWLSEVGTWSRPLDFAAGTTAGAAYVLITTGSTQAGSAWVCSTPTSIINTDPLLFVQFSLAGQVTGQNVGTGAGEIFRDKTGLTLNFKTIAAGTHMVVTNTTNEVELSTDATSDNTPNTIVSRNASGIISVSDVRFEDAGGGEYVGLSAPITVTSSYTVDLPASAPIAGQVLQATSASATQWATVGGLPAVNETYYVSLDGDDGNDGSFGAPFRTVLHAVNIANTVASLANPVAISVGAGIFIEDNSGGPLTITAPGICIIGSSLASTIITPSTRSNDLFSVTTGDVEITDLTLSGTTGSTASAINQATTVYGRTHYDNIAVSQFQTAFDVSATGTVPALFFENVLCAGNGTCFALDNVAAIIKTAVLRGALSGGPVNTGVTLTGTNAQVEILSSVFQLFTTAVSITGGASLSMSACDLDTSISGIVCAGASSTKLTGLTFKRNSASSINVSASQAGTGVYVVGCLFDCEDASDNPQGTAIQATTGASIIVDSSTIEMAVVGIQTGTTGDTSTTTIRAISVGLTECTTDINQVGLSTLQFVGGTFEEAKLSIADSTNVHIAAFNSDGQAILALGDGSDVTHPLYQVLNGQATLPSVQYNPSYYGYRGTVYQNPNADPTFNATQAQSNDAAYYVVTGDRTKKAGVNLISDTGNFGVGDFVRGWSMTKEGTQADLAFTYSNNDTSGLAARGANAIMNLNGFDNQVEFPIAANTPLPTNTVAKLVWAGDTNLYRDAANTLKTDDNLVVGSLTPAGVVHNDAAGLLSTSLIVNADISALAAITDNKLATISTAGKVANSATTATAVNTPNTIVLRDSSGNFAAGTITADLIGNASTATTAINTTNFTGLLSGDVTGTQGATVVSFVGGQSAANVAAATVAANAATPTNTPSTIVSRDASGNFSAGIITASLIGNVTGNLFGNATTATTANSATNFTGSLAGDVSGTQGATVVNTVGGQTAANVAAATVLANGATSSNTASAIVRRDGSGNFSAGTITANITGNLTGDVTGNLFGNATTATSALTANSATTFTGPLLGDVTGTQGATVVSFVGGQSAANIAVATSAVLTATSNNMPNTLVLRDSLSNFSTNMISIGGTITNPTDVTTKAYVDAAVAGGFTVKDPALATSLTNVSLTGTPTIDGVVTVTNDRVLLVGQTDPMENGLWLTAVGTWTRPLDFASGTTAGTAYVLTTSGLTQAGTGWVCSTPSAIIDTDPLAFSQFSIAGQTTAANVGTGAGQLFRDKTGQTINLKTIAAGTHMVVTNNTNEVTLSTDATSANTPSTLVARDASGNFSAGIMTGSASNNVLKIGDTMTGNLNMASQSEVRFEDAAGGEYVGLHAPAIVTASYTISLPDGAPVAGQVLFASSSATTTWKTVDEPPSVTKTYYVSLAGNDSNDGSLSAPFRTVLHAVNVANTVASLTNPVAISVGAGIFVEDNSGGPLTITAPGICIIGSSLASTIILPSTASADLFNITTGDVEITELSLSSTTGSTASAINQATTVYGRTHYDNIAVSLFQTAFDISATGTVPVLFLENILCAGNGTCFAFNNVQAIIQTAALRGPLGGGPTNTGVTITGTNAQVEILSSVFQLFTTAVSITGGASLTMSACDLDTTINGIVCAGASSSKLTGLTFKQNSASSVNISASQAGTAIYAVGCLFDCEDASENPQGTAIRSTTGASIIVDSSAIEMAVVGIQTGTTGDTASTIIQTSAVGLLDCVTDVLQEGSATLAFFGGSFNANNLSIADGTNVSFASADISMGGTLTFGSDIEESHTLYQVLTGAVNKPNLSYTNNYYGNKGTVYQNLNADPTFNATQAQSNDAAYYVVTGDRTKKAGVNLISDTGNFGVGDFVRGWSMTKEGTQADLAFTYSNNDTSGLAARGPNSVVNFNGFDNQVEFPAAANAPLPTNTVAKLVWAGDTNLYRDSANTLKTDDNLVVATLTPAGVVHNDASGLLTSSLIVNSDISVSAGITDNKLATISTAGKVANSATTATSANTPNTIVLRDASGDFSAGIITANLNGNATTATSAGNFSGVLSGDVTGTQGATVVSFVGGQSAANVAAATVAANAATPTNTPSTIVSRDASGNFSAGTITASLIGNVTGNLFGNATTATTANSATNFTGSLAGDVSGTQGATVVNTVGGQTAANVAAATVLANGATSSNTASAIVRRDGSGSFSAGTITAALIGAASLNVLKAGDTMTGTLTLPAGTNPAPALQFIGSVGTGVSAAVANQLSFATSGTQRLSISDTVITTAVKLALTKILCNQAMQVVPIGTNTVTVSDSTSVIVKKYTGATTLTVTFPASPTDGQLLTIIAVPTAAANLTISPVGATFATVNGSISPLNPNNNMNATSNGATVTYIYNLADNTWYRYNRG